MNKRSNCLYPSIKKTKQKAIKLVADWLLKSTGKYERKFTFDERLTMDLTGI
jgi:hypothetical protein